MSLRAPNSEQKIAIEHSGGALLSAGAGSGKTFVLIEHSMFLLKEFIKKETFLDLDEFERKIKLFLSKITYMTFTKKAAGELSVRLKNRFEQEVLNLSDNDTLKLWQAESLVSLIDNLSVTTIHGFCYKLLKRGFFPGVNIEQDIIGIVELRDKIDSLVDKWFELNKEKYSKSIDLLILNKKQMTDAFISIFMSPESRILWRSIDPGSINDSDEEKLVSRLLSVLSVDNLSVIKPNWEDFEAKKRPKWSEKGIVLQNFFQSNKLEKISELLEVNKFLDDFGRMPPIKKEKVSEEVFSFYQKVKKIRKFLKDNHEDLEAYTNEKEGAFMNWAYIMKDLYEFIEECYGLVPGLTFSDMEYLVSVGLEDREVCQQVQKEINYLVVDEFQDTSEIQFEIIKKIIGMNFNKLFCVGDMKQAIYGFRGGELGVFKACSEKISKNISLINNYRSYERVIHFNNILFDDIFPKGNAFENLDGHAVEVEAQKSPGIYSSKGHIGRHFVNITGDPEVKSLSAIELDSIEAEEITKIVLAQRNEEKDGKKKQCICILFRKLTPVKYLFPLLLKNSISFTCQIKIPFSEDPILSLFFTLLIPFGEKKSKEPLLEIKKMSEVYIKILGGNTDIIANQVSLFYEDLNVIGLWESYKRFLFNIGIHNSNYKNNLTLIHSFCKIAGDEAFKLLEKVQLSDESYSVDFQIGDNPQSLKIMTAHASKGLEFEKVIIGGIHTNGSSKSNTDIFGKLPYSYKWRSSLNKKKPFKSPEYIFENLLNEKKNFSESKRLFYVASTRAEHELIWIDIHYNSCPQSFSKNSWINGIRSWQNDKIEESSKVIETKEILKIKDWEKDQIQKSSRKVPLFHQDNIGIQFRNSLSESTLAIVSELSVTRLATIVECPRKFYFKNILKIEDDSLSGLEAEYKETLEEKSFEREIGEKLKSNANRGTLVHEAISYAIKRNWVLPMNLTEKRDLLAANWAIDALKPYRKSHELTSEEPLKFRFFGLMISGTPDLYLIPKDSDEEKKLIPEVWDFKTGAGNSTSIKSYWFQLMTYGYGLYELKLIHIDQKISLKLVFVDKEETVEREFGYIELRDQLYQEWTKLTGLNQKNLDSCQSCSYGNICHSS